MPLSQASPSFMAASRGGEVDLQADDFDTTLEKEEDCYGCSALWANAGCQSVICDNLQIVVRL